MRPKTLRNESVTMFVSVLCFHILVRVLSEATAPPPPPPQNIHVDKWQMTWTPSTKEADVTYTVEYRSYGSDKWRVVLACSQIPSNSCDVTVTKAQSEHGCVMLRVRAERHGVKSVPVKGCSRHGDSCTPEFSLTARPGSMTVHLSRNHSLAQELADNAKHRIYFGKEGEPLEELEDSASSRSIGDLQGGQRYCAMVQFVTFKKPAGLSSCVQCELVPVSESKQTIIIVAVVVVVVLVVMVPAIAWVLLFKRGQIKKLLWMPYQPVVNLESLPERPLSPLTSSPTEEHFDLITSMTPLEVGGE